MITARTAGCIFARPAQAGAPNAAPWRVVWSGVIPIENMRRGATNRHRVLATMISKGANHASEMFRTARPRNLHPGDLHPAVAGERRTAVSPQPRRVFLRSYRSDRDHDRCPMPPRGLRPIRLASQFANCDHAFLVPLWNFNRFHKQV